jgi:hypothetical protein
MNLPPSQSIITFLASEGVCWITGDTIHVDGDSKL